jgi:hypothetical protein
MELNTGGIIFMVTAYTIIISVITYCYYKVFKTQGKN